MDSGRVGVCHRLENKRRQFLIVVNDVARSKCDSYNDIVDKDKADADYRFEKSKMFVRRALVRQRVLQQCMKMRRTNLDRNPHNNLYGRYGGRSIEQFGREIETFIAMNHPKIRRQRQIKRLMEEGLAQGKLLEQKTVSDKMQTFLQRSLTKMRLKRIQKEKSQISVKRESSKINQRQGLPRLPVLTNPFFTNSRRVVENDSNQIMNVEIKPVRASGPNEVNILKLTDDVQNMTVTDRKRQNRTDDEQVKELKAQNVLKELGQLDTTVLDPGPRTQLVLPPIKSTNAIVQN